MEEKSLAMEMLQELKKANKRNFAIIVILLVVLVGSNIAWLVYESQYETIVEETTVDAGDGTATYLENSNSGDITYGENN